jgi:hypothetical protein
MESVASLEPAGAGGARRVTQVLPLRALDIVSPAPRAIWNDVVAADPHALVTQTPAWTDALCANPLYVDASRLYITPLGRQMIVPMVRRRGFPGRLRMEASLAAHWGFGGILAADGVTSDDVRIVLSDLQQRRALRQTIRPNPLDQELWAAHSADVVRVDRRAHVIDLTAGADAVWSAFRSNARRAVRSAEKHGVTVEHDTRGRLLPQFFDLLELSRERWSKQLHEPAWLARIRNRGMDSLEKWQRISAALDGRCHVWLASVDAKPAAGIIVLQGRNAHYTRGAMDKDVAGPSYANYALHWQALQHACAEGSQAYHMGESGTSTSMARYKEQFGARPYDYEELRIERLPLTRADHAIRSAVKRVVGFKDAE